MDSATRDRAEPAEPTTWEVPLVDLRAQHVAIAGEVEEGFARIIRESAFILGHEVAAFERAFASFCNVRACVGVASGTDALEFVLRTLDVGPGSEVILPTNSFVATAFAVIRAGATPVLVDCDPLTYLIDTGQVKDRITRRTKAVIATHLYGQMAPMEELTEVAAAGIGIVEDAAQAHGALRNGRSAGGFGVAAATSFYPSKNLGAYGDGGAVLTDSDEVAERVRRLGNHGSEVKYRHSELGFNSRLDTLQAVVLNAKLRHLPRWNEARRQAATLYDALLREVEGIQRPTVAPGNTHVWHLYVVRVSARDKTLRRLHGRSIAASIHYPTPIHLQGAFRDLGHRPGDFPVAEEAAREILSLPIHPEITPQQQERVVDALREALA